MHHCYWALAPLPVRCSTHAISPIGVKPTIVLVHGAWADGSSWAGVTVRLQDDGYTVLAPANPLRDLTTDSAYLSSVLSSISGPIVLVAHSYGGMVMTNAATGNANVKALGLAGVWGETSDVDRRRADCTQSRQRVDSRQSDLPSLSRGDRCLHQISAAVLSEASGAPAWASIPSWYMVATHDEAIPPATERFMAMRAHSTTAQVSSSHAVLVSHPQAVTNLITEAARAVS